MTPTGWRSFVLPFGKWRGSRLSEVAIRDESYIQWLSRTVGGEVGEQCRVALREIQDFAALSKFFMRGG